MKKALIILTTLLVLVSCDNSNRSKTLSDTRTDKQITDSSKNKSERKNLILEVKKLRQKIASKDKEKIAAIFEFPLSGESFSIYTHNKFYNQQFETNGNKITRTMFLQHYKEISESIWLEQLNNLFHNINIDSLLYKDTLEYEAYIITDPCFFSYQIELTNESITFRMNMNSNVNYKSKTLSEDDIPENSSEICEHSFWWIFKINENKLHLESISGAG